MSSFAKPGLRSRKDSQLPAPENAGTEQLGQELNCVRCDEFARIVAEAVIKECRASLVAAYEFAGTSGLCAEGRWEMALDSLRSINLSKIIS